MNLNQRKRKMMLILPLLAIPFLTMAFWALGGGKEHGKQSLGVQGLNLSLPDPKLKEQPMSDKLSFYDQADKDSVKMAEWMRNDPYYKGKADTSKPTAPPRELEELTEHTASKYKVGLNTSPFDKTKEPPEKQVMDKLALLQEELGKHSSNTEVSDPVSDNENVASPELAGATDRLESMLKGMNSKGEEDPEMKQISSVMDKILDIQHPDRVKDRMKDAANRRDANTMIVSSTADDDTAVNGFYGLDNVSPANFSNSIEAVVNEDQTLVNGAIIKLRLLQDIYINHAAIPAGNFVFGVVSLDGERLGIDIPSIRSGSNVYAVKLQVYDMDGLSGIYIPGAISRDVAKQSADNSLQMMELSTLDPSLKAQATAAGINGVKSLLAKKAKLVKVTVKAGYKLLLKNKTNEL